MTFNPKETHRRLINELGVEGAEEVLERAGKQLKRDARNFSQLVQSGGLSPEEAARLVLGDGDPRNVIKGAKRRLKNLFWRGLINLWHIGRIFGWVHPLKDFI